MVRAAVSGAIDYSRADPTNINWRLKQKLVLQEIQRRESIVLFEALHRQWLAYVSHGGLTPESFADVKKSANTALDRLESIIFPWSEAAKKETQNDTIETISKTKDGEVKLDPKTQKLVDSYKQWQAELEKKAASENKQ